MIATRSATVADARAIRAVQVSSWRSTYRGLVPDVFLDAMTIDGHVARWEHSIRTSGCLVTSDGERVVGFVSVGSRSDPPDLATEYDGQVRAIYLLESYWGRGLGRELMHRGAVWLRDAGFRSAVVWALDGNTRGRRFYERLGAALTEHVLVDDRGDFQLTEVAYGWSHVNELVRRSQAPA